MTRVTTSHPKTFDTYDTVHGLQPLETSLGWEHANSSPARIPFEFPKKKNVLTILLIGETGSGKTSFMSLLLNLFQGNGPFELKDRHFLEAQSGLDRSQSQTTEARLYSFTAANGVRVEILDTPGLADTRGIEEDKKHKERICCAIRDLVTMIDGILIVANGRVERLTVATDYTLNTLATLFPRSIVSNIGIIFTSVGASGAGLNFQMNSLPSELQKVQHWCIDNPLSLHKNYLAQTARGALNNRQKAKQERNLEANYEDAIESLDGWLEWLDERKVIPTSAIIELYQKSSEIESRLFSTIAFIGSLSDLECKLLDISSALNATGEEKARLAGLKQTLPTQIWVVKGTSHYNTICTVPGCHVNCHVQCSLELGDPAILGGSCKAFKTLGIPNRWLPFWSNAEVKCGMAGCGHPAKAHRHYKKAHEKTINTVYQQVVKDLQHVSTKQGQIEAAKAAIEGEVTSIKHEVEKSKREIPQLIDELNRISLSPNYAIYIRSALDILKMRKEQLEYRLDPGNELAIINDGITTLEAQLALLRENEAGRVVETSPEGTQS
ncbi:unnamed protein product [Rhizoctonia solani]|uniref:AIG1-type G domain-containing protein n=1 Tax=Rhizoctonia solani TaxID=456999 RepID=A0A8H3CI30_9AGAM|nr:unnamed protein product [Rhizoctonia solani]